MIDKTVNSREAIARAGRPGGELRPARTARMSSKQRNDPLLRVEEYSHDGAIGPTANDDIDRTVYDN
jgi:hypothetical protein